MQNRQDTTEEVEEVRWQEEKRCASDGFYYTERISAGVVSKEWRMILDTPGDPSALDKR